MMDNHYAKQIVAELGTADPLRPDNFAGVASAITAGFGSGPLDRALSAAILDGHAGIVTRSADGLLKSAQRARKRFCGQAVLAVGAAAGGDLIVWAVARSRSRFRR